MPRIRSTSVYSSRATEIVDGIRKQMGLFTPPPLSAPKAPLRELETANVSKVLSYNNASSNQPWGYTSVGTEPIPITSDVVVGAMIIDEEMRMDWEFEQPAPSIAQMMDEEMARQELDIDGDVIMGEPDGYPAESPEIEMASLPAYTFTSLDPPAALTDVSGFLSSTLLASPTLEGESSSSSSTYSRKGKERALPSISEEVERCIMKSAAPSAPAIPSIPEEDEGCMMKFTAPSKRALPSISEEDEGCMMKFTAPSVRATKDEGLPGSSYMLGYVDGHPSSSLSTPDHGPKAVDAKVPILSI